MRLTIKGSNKKVITLYKELRLRVRRDNLDMVISKSKAEEEAEIAIEKKAIEADEKIKAAKEKAIKLEEKKENDAKAKAEAANLKVLQDKAIVRDRKEVETRAALKAKAEKKALLEAEEKKKEEAIAYVMDKMDKETIKPAQKRGIKQKGKS